MMYQTGAILYIFWGLLHLFAAFQVFKLGAKLEKGMVKGRIFQNALNLAFFAMIVMVIAVVYNWENSSLGYWLNLVVASITDIGFIIYILVPGYLPRKPGILGPALWILATVFSTVGIISITSK
ncbi:MAG: hypothetical protein ACHQET_03920 [Chitinophagales bacterium]